MKFSDVELPPNRQFGFFFSGVFFIIFLYFYLDESTRLATYFFIASMIMAIISLVKPNLLFSLNKFWMCFGLILGIIITPLVLGIIFFGLFTPIAIFIKLIGRDELRLKLYSKKSNWIYRDIEIKYKSLKNQF